MELSIVMPFYKRFDVLSKTLDRNARCYGTHIELVLVMDEPSQEHEVLKLAQEWKSFHWKVIINRNDHDWRNPSKAINVGIKQASCPFILVTSPETVWITDVPNQLFIEAQKRTNHFHFGEIAFCDPKMVSTLEQFRTLRRMSCGSLCTAKENLERVRGYDESLIGWGADDDNVRARLSLSKTWGMCHHHVALIHPPMVEKHRIYSKDTASRINKIVRPDTFEANKDTDWGVDFNEVLFQS